MASLLLGCARVTVISLVCVRLLGCAHVAQSAAHYAVAKSVAVKVDFSLFCPHAVALLLHWGDIDAVRSRCLPRLLAGWQSVHRKIREGDVSWKSLFFETSFLRMFGLIAPLLLGDYEALARLQEHCLHGLVLRDEVAKGIFEQMHGGSRPPDAEVCHRCSCLSDMPCCL